MRGHLRYRATGQRSIQQLGLYEGPAPPFRATGQRSCRQLGLYEVPIQPPL